MKTETLQTREQLNEKIRSLILDVVNAKGPISSVAVAVEVTAAIAKGEHGAFDVPANNLMDGYANILEACIFEEGIAELEYTHPSTEYKVSSLLFPIGTRYYDWHGDGR